MQGQSYSDAGATAYDAVDGAITNITTAGISAINTRQVKEMHDSSHLPCHACLLGRYTLCCICHSLCISVRQSSVPLQSAAKARHFHNIAYSEGYDRVCSPAELFNMSLFCPLLFVMYNIW